MRVRVALAAAAALALVVLDLRADRLPLPQRATLIPQEVFTGGMRAGLLRFGLEYGTGVRTLIPSAAPYVVALALLAANLPWWQTVLAGLAFGLGRALAALLLVLTGAPSFQTFLAGHKRLLERASSVAAGICVLVAAWGLLA